MCNGIPFTIEKILASGGLELTTARSAGQRLTHSATGTPVCQVEGLMWCVYLFVLFEGIGKSTYFNSILNFAILSDFKMRNSLERRRGRRGVVVEWLERLDYGAESCRRHATTGKLSL